jgi:hypothetical protein
MVISPPFLIGAIEDGDGANHSSPLTALCLIKDFEALCKNNRPAARLSAALTMLQRINDWLNGQRCKIGTALVPKRARPRSHPRPQNPQRSGPPSSDRGPHSKPEESTAPDPPSQGECQKRSGPIFLHRPLLIGRALIRLRYEFFSGVVIRPQEDAIKSGPNSNGRELGPEFNYASRRISTFVL